MTTRLIGVLVTFEADIREDDAEARIAAIQQIRGVLCVTPVEADSLDDRIAEQRVRRELGQKLLAILYPERESS